jgi:hypothetical protein
VTTLPSPAGSQAYERKFPNHTPRDGDRSDPAYDWLSRGLEEALLALGLAHGICVIWGCQLNPACRMDILVRVM